MNKTMLNTSTIGLPHFTLDRKEYSTFNIDSMFEL